MKSITRVIEGLGFVFLFSLIWVFILLWIVACV